MQQHTVKGHFSHTLRSTHDLVPSGWARGDFYSKRWCNYLLIAGALRPEERSAPCNPQPSLAPKPFLQTESTQKSHQLFQQREASSRTIEAPLVPERNIGLARSLSSRPHTPLIWGIQHRARVMLLNPSPKEYGAAVALSSAWEALIGVTVDFRGIMYFPIATTDRLLTGQP